MSVTDIDDNTIEWFWWLHNTSCWKIQRQGFVDMYLYLPTMRYVYKTSFGEARWHGTKNPNPLPFQSEKERSKAKTFNTEIDAVKWLSKSK